MSDAPDFVGLRHAISKVKKASQKLDCRKTRAEHRLKHALEKLSRHHHHKHSACDHRKFAKARVWVKKVFGVNEEKEISDSQKWPEGARVTPRFGRLPVWAAEQRRTKEHKHDQHPKEHGHRHKDHGHHHKHDDHNHKGLRKLIRAVKEVQAVNKKLSTFEQGFISEGGIPDREW
jgi:N-acetylated-alpha-linked acidic dipeptidase